MRNITDHLQDLYIPQKALLLYKHQLEKECYMEAYDMDENGTPINARPLTIKEAGEIAQLLQTNNRESFLQQSGLLQKNILYIDNRELGCVLWHTPCRKLPLFFKKELDIPCGKAYVPALLWKATRTELYLYALHGNNKPTMKTTLYYAPFFNIYEDGRVCMGTVEVDISTHITLDTFIKTWQQYFFQSYFSHSIGGLAPLKGNIIQVWKEQVSTGRRFPDQLLKKHSYTVKKLLP